MPARDPFEKRAADLNPAIVRDEVRRFLAEDIGAGDITSRWTVPADSVTRGTIVARESCVLAGLDVAAAVFSELDVRLRLQATVRDGDCVASGCVVATIDGPTAPILTGERLALNLLQRLSGIATLTRRFVDEIAGTGASISDTRKTTPGLRAFEKYAVRTGGGRNNRSGLYDAVLIKDNHIVAAGGVTPALNAVRGPAADVPVQIEVDTIDQLAEALAAGVDAILLDNMTPDAAAEAVRTIRAHPGGTTCWIEASGGITLANVRRYAEAGVDTISIGGLTHSARAVDLALDLVAA